MRKKSIVNAVVALVLVGLAALVLFLTPFQVAGKNLSMIKMGDVTPNALISIVKNAPATFMNLFAALGFTGSSASAITFSKFGMPWILFGGLIFLVLVWLIQFIGFIAKRRGSGTVCTILYLITAAAGYMILLSAVTAGAIVPGATIASIVKGGLDFSGNFVRKAIVVGQLAYTALPFVLAVVALIMAIVYEFQSLADAVKNGKKRVKKAKEAKSAKNAKLGTVKEDEPAPAATEETKPEEKPVDEAALKAAQYEELAKANQIELNTESHGPQIVQNFYASAPAPQPAPAPVQYVPYPYPPFPPYYPYPQPEPKKEEPAPAPAPEPAPAPAPVVEEDNRPLTAKELREIIAEALDDHDHPENDRPLTDDEARDLIRQELDAYYAGSTPAVEEEPVVETVEDDTLTGDDLRAIIREEIAALAPAPAPEPEPVVEEPAPEPAPAPAISLDDIRSVITDALAAQSAKDAEKEEAQKAVEERQNEAIKAIADSVLTAEEIRTIVSEEMDKKAAEAPAPEPTLSGDDIRAIIREEMAAEEPVAEPALSSDDIRAIIREEIASLTPAPAPEPAPAPVAEPAPVEETVVVEPEPVVEEPVAEPAPAPVVYERKTFADRFADCDQSLLDNYNELKAYLLSYGLKSRLSNSGDTFRLSCVTYCKITVAGKGLKLYLALKPSDFADSPIPVIDASAKNIYKDIPTCFKVKSGLSMKRAKQLIDMACTAKQGDNEPLVQGDIVTANYAEELKDYKPQGGDEDDADEE
ncbi:MAG: hypothetical protein MJ241_00985 [Bacilli bacterium]|nr:hypothetical protein [Bacilli bacterium]